MSVVATLMGDMNMLWICIFLSFFGPSMLMKKEQEKVIEVQAEDKEDHVAGDLQLTERGSIIVAEFTKLYERLDDKIPKFSEWQDEQRVKKEASTNSHLNSSAAN